MLIHPDKKAFSSATWAPQQFFLLCLSLFFTVFPFAFAHAVSTAWQEEEQIRTRIVSAQDSFAQGGFFLGVEQELKKGWKTYWRSPGAAGYPLRIDAQGSENLKTLEILWPVPRRFAFSGLENFGYRDSVLFPVKVELEDPKKPLELQLLLSYLVCNEICIPYENRFSLHLSPGIAFDSLEAPLIQEALDKVPAPYKGEQQGFDAVHLVKRGQELWLKGTVQTATGADGDLAERSPGNGFLSRKDDFSGFDIIVEGPPSFAFSPPHFNRLDRHKFVFDIAVENFEADQTTVLEGKQLLLTFVHEEGKSFERQIVAHHGFDADTGRMDIGWLPSSAIFSFLVLAFFGGLILNIMPCVLPVLSLKFMVLVSRAGQDQLVVRRGFIVTAGGILVSFLLLALAAMSLKALGLSIGWGMQFQQPVFLVFMVFVLLFFALNLFGLFTIPSPSFVNDLAVEKTASRGYRSDFYTGVFATLLATPCSAPFLGTAVAFALSGSILDILVIFLALGLGMSLPYLVISAFPQLARVVPRPGGWMKAVKLLMGVALLGTSFWFVTVIYAQTGPWLVAGLLGFCLLSLLCLCLPVKGRWVFVALLFVGAMSLAFFAPSSETAERKEENWLTFDEDAILGLVAQGRVVFVNVTADWCITCQVNKRLVLDRRPIRRVFHDNNVVLMQADWTKPDEAIFAYLEANGRYGIPFNKVYGPQKPEGLDLPEILTQNQVLKAVNTVLVP